MKFVPKASEVEAVQFKNKDLPKLKGGAVDVEALNKKGWTLVSVVREGHNVVGVRLETNEFAVDGDYIVKGDGGPYVVEQSDFEALYEPKK